MILQQKHNMSIFETPTLDRPLIVYHPGPHRNFKASWSVMEGLGTPFALICDDTFPWYPDDEYEPLIDQFGYEIFTRMDTPLIGGRGYRKPLISHEHIMIHRQKDARKGIQDLPFCDILYIDFFDIFSAESYDWSVEQVTHQERQLREIEILSNYIIDGGYIFVDKKNKNNGEGLPKQKTALKNGVEIEFLGTSDVLSWSFEDDMSTQIEVYRIHSTQSFDQPYDFLAECVLERRLSVEQLSLRFNSIPLSPPPYYTLDQYCERWLLHIDLPFAFSPPTVPISNKKTWRRISAYNRWLTSLIEHKDQLRPPTIVSDSFSVGDIDVTIVRGDIFDHADLLVWKNAAVVARKKFIKPIIEKRWELAQHAVALQNDWSNRLRIPNLIWSGKQATPFLTKELLNTCDHHTVATVAHGLATIEEIQQSLERYQGPVKQLLIFAIDEDDYSMP